MLKIIQNIQIVIINQICHKNNWINYNTTQEQVNNIINSNRALFKSNSNGSYKNN